MKKISRNEYTYTICNQLQQEKYNYRQQYIPNMISYPYEESNQKKIKYLNTLQQISTEKVLICFMIFV